MGTILLLDFMIFSLSLWIIYFQQLLTIISSTTLTSTTTISTISYNNNLFHQLQHYISTTTSTTLQPILQYNFLIAIILFNGQYFYFYFYFWISCNRYIFSIFWILGNYLRTWLFFSLPGFQPAHFAHGFQPSGGMFRTPMFS